MNGTDPIIQLIAAMLLVLGCFFCLSAAVGLLRFPDVITRLHAATKPQVFGLVLILSAIGLRLWSWESTCLVVLVAGFQVLTAPVSAHMVSRTAYRLGLWNANEAVIDELAEDLENAGYTHPHEDDEPGGNLPAGRHWRTAAVPARPRRDRG